MAKIAPNKPISLPQQIADLNVGESVARAHRIDFDTATRASVAKARERLINAGTSALTRGRKLALDNPEYRMETGSFETSSRDLMLCLVITRVA